MNIDIFTDNKLSWRAKGILAFLMLAKSASFNEVMNFSKDGRTAVSSALKELKNNKYCEIVITRETNGSFKSGRYYPIERCTRYVNM